MRLQNRGERCVDDGARVGTIAATLIAMENTPPFQTVSEDKTAAILSYITVVGFIIAIVLQGQKKTRLGAYHLRQSLGIYLTGVVAGVLVFIPVLGWILMPAVWLALVVFWVMGLIAAAQGRMTPVPLVGQKIQDLLTTAFD